MKSNTVEQDRRATRLDELVALVRAKVAPEQRETLEAFVRSTTARSIRRTWPSASWPTCTARRCRTGTSRASASPAARACACSTRRIEEHGWQSTHTVIEIVNDDMPFLVDSVTMEVNRHGLTLHLIIHPLILAWCATRDGTLPGLATDGTPTARRESFIHVEVDRISEPARLEALAADVARVLGDVRAGGRRLEGDARTRARHRRASSTQRPPPIPAGGTGRRPRVPALARRQPLHVPRLPAPRPRRRSTARTRCRSCPARASASCARARGQGRRGELRRAAARGARVRAAARAAGDHQVDRALDGAPAGLSRLHRRQALRRDRQGHRRGPLPRPLHVDGLQRQSGRHPAAAAQGRRTSSRAPALAPGQPRRQGADQHPRHLSARRAVPDRPRTTCCAPRWASCTWATASASACSCAAIRSSASCRASSTRRARTTRPNCGRSGRRSWSQAFNGTQLRVQRPPVGVDAGAHPDHRAHDAGQDPRLRRARARGAAGCRRRGAGTTTSRTRWSRRSARRAATSCCAASATRSRRLPRGVRGARRGARHRDDGEADRRPAARRCACTGRSRPPPGTLRFKSVHLGAPVTLSDSLPMLEHMGLQRARRASAPHRAARHARRSGCTTSACSRRMPRRRRRGRRAARGVRGRVRRASSAARSRTTTSTAWSSPRACRPTRSWCCAPTRSTCARSASRCRRRSSRPRSPRMPASRARWSSCSRRASTRHGGARRRCARGGAASARSRRRSSRSRTCPRTACCASTSR